MWPWMLPASHSGDGPSDVHELGQTCSPPSLVTAPEGGDSHWLF